MGPTDEDPAVFDARTEVLDAVVGFVRRLRRNGVAVPADGAIVATEALAELDSADRQRVRAALKATLVTRQRDLDPFEQLFESFWHDLRFDERDVPDVLEDLADSAVPFGAAEDERTAGGREDQRGGNADPDDPGRGDDQDAGSLRMTTTSASQDSGVTGETVEIARYSPTGESTQIEPPSAWGNYPLEEPVIRMTRALSTMPGRRRTRTSGGRFVDGRRALRESFGTGGVVATLPEAERADSVVHGAVLVDVSQSVLDSLDRSFLLEWLWLLSDHWRTLRTFFFDTDVREVTDAFDERTVGDVAGALASAEAAWGGGTRIGHAFSAIQRSYPGAVDRRTIVVVVSDGLERGDLDDLREGVAWLSRRGALFLWLNPLAAHPEYEPTARGMAAAMPAVDGLFAFAGVDDVAELARQLERHDRTRLGYEFDPRRSG